MSQHPFPGGVKFTDEEIDNFLTFLVEGAEMSEVKGISAEEFKATSNVYRIITQLKEERDEATKSS